MDEFDPKLAKSCGLMAWRPRYRFDPDMRACRMFWNDGCTSTSRNDFDDQETCEWKCEGRHPRKEGHACLSPFDPSYLGDCRHGDFLPRYYFDINKKQCVAFHWGGCQSSSPNIFMDMTDCRQLCETPPRQLVQSCLAPFDHSYREQCGDGRWQQYYFFDHATHTCRMFWFGNCKGDSQNIFPSLSSCQWICERHREERVPAHCSDPWDPAYAESCGRGQWRERWYFDHSSGRCSSFWHDGCTSPSQNIFPDEKSCVGLCEQPGFAVEGHLPHPDSSYKCLEPMQRGECRETYPFFHYDRKSRSCKPFAYSGCGGNDNRFLTLSQCEGLCSIFNDVLESEMDCYLPLDVGYGRNDAHCIDHAGYRFYFDRDYGTCSKFWYLGCGGNANAFHTYETCQHSCRMQSRRGPMRPLLDSVAGPSVNGTRTDARRARDAVATTVCFLPAGMPGKCKTNATEKVDRWTYAGGSCRPFKYNGCGGNKNRFSSQRECEQLCGGLLPSNNPEICSFLPDWGTCNRLEYKWYYNMSRGTCDQFLYGGCDGNTNRFDTFNECQKACEVSGLDPCLEKLDRGTWCATMQNRYYFNQRSRTCKGFHYTGCGRSGNLFTTLDECQSKCRKHMGAVRVEGDKTKKGRKKLQGSGYSNSKPREKTPMSRHIELRGDNVTYWRTEEQWVDYQLCIGYRYNISGRDTVLRVHLCAHAGNRDCDIETYPQTDGEEFCMVQRPFLRGTYPYSWYFELVQKAMTYDGSERNRGVQTLQQTTATVLLLSPNQCHDMC